MLLRDEANGWLRVGEVGPQLLAGTREQLHWAVRLLGVRGLGGTGAGPQPMHWLADDELLASVPLPRPRPLRIAIGVSSFSALVVDSKDRPYLRFSLDGRTLEDARVWLEATVRDYTGDDSIELALPEAWPAPKHPVAGGRVFRLEASAACVELARWYAGAAAVLGAVARLHHGAGPVACWPERLDLRTTIPVGSSGGDTADASIVLGMSPGDAHDGEPYWYVTVDRSCGEQPLPGLGHSAEWRTTCTAPEAILRARHLVRGSAVGQRERLEAFLGEAIAVCRKLLRAARD